MKITLNGIEKEIPDSVNLNQVINQFCKDNRRIIADLNGDVVQSIHWHETIIKNGDTIELVSLVGGG